MFSAHLGPVKNHPSYTNIMRLFVVAYVREVCLYIDSGTFFQRYEQSAFLRFKTGL